MTDRLRRLDVLFAERVLGHTVAHVLVTSSQSASDGWQFDYDRTKGSILLPGPFPLPTYTRSLDAAWEGVDKLDGAGEGCFHLCHAYQGNDRGWHAKFGCGGDIPTIGYGWATHPAEALVIACLRAVGCSEEGMERV